MNQKQKKDIIIGVGLGLITTIAIIYFFVTYMMKRRNKNSTSNTLFSKSNICNTSGNNHDAEFPLKKGSKGNEVKELQQWLNTKGEKLCVDGIWGNKTEQAFQKYKSELFWSGDSIPLMAYLSAFNN